MKPQRSQKAHNDFTDELAAMLPPKRVKRSRQEAEREIFQIRLADLRKRMGVRQEDLTNFSQSAVSRLESRKDVKISTLIEYVENIGMGIEIKVYPKNQQAREDDIVLLKV